MLARVAVDEDRIWMTNVYKALPERAQLSPEEIQEHLPYLIHEIHESQPKYILALGDVAFHALTDIAMSISLYRGFWQPLAEALRREHPMPDPSLSPKDQIPLIQPIVLPTYHPAHILRNRKQLPIWQRDIAEWYAKESAA
jgi:uracil-DNA glycosylase